MHTFHSTVLWLCKFQPFHSTGSRFLLQIVPKWRCFCISELHHLSKIPTWWWKDCARAVGESISQDSTTEWDTDQKQIEAKARDQLMNILMDLLCPRKAIHREDIRFKKTERIRSGKSVIYLIVSSKIRKLTELKEMQACSWLATLSGFHQN